MSQIFNTIQDVSKNYGKYDKWEQEKANKNAKKEYLVQHLNVPKEKIDLTRKRAEAVIRATEIMDTRSEDNCENMEQVVSIAQIVPTMTIPFLQIPAAKILEKIFKMAPAKAMNIASYGSIGLMFAVVIAMIGWGNAKQKEASRIGRFQARKNELKGLENFVEYTPEQIKQAQEIAKKIPDKNEKKGLAQAFEQFREMNKEKSNYHAWQRNKDPKEIEKLKNIELSDEELKKANENKELITNTVSEINIRAEEYSENLENAFDTFGTLSFLVAAPLGFGINSILNKFKVSKKANLITSILVPALTTLFIQMAGTIEQKEASRIGRHQARKDLLKNPARLMSFTKEEMDLAKNVNAPEQKIGLFKKIGKSFAFLKDYYKDKKEYKNYKENTQKQKEKLQEAFKHVQISEEQKRDAKLLQTNVFRAFDEVDEMSQRYSEDIEATTEVAKETVSTAWGFISGAALAALALWIKKGKISLAKPVKWLSNITFNQNSSLGNSIKRLCDTLQKGKKGSAGEFQNALLSKNKISTFLEKAENAEIKTAYQEVVSEVNKIANSGIAEISNKGNSKNANSIYDNLIKEHLKQTRTAKWVRGLLGDIAKLWTKKNITKSGIDIPKEMQEQLGLNFSYKNYKTLCNTSLVAGVPVLGFIFSVPYIFNAWLTDIQKKAGKIGIMKAMEKIDDPKVFANHKINNKDF